MITRTFGSFNFEEVEELFQIKQVETLSLLDEWLIGNTIINEHKQYIVEDLKKQMKKHALVWNEDELKMFFIGPLVYLADLETEDLKSFTQRSLAANINDLKITGRVDFMIAKGRKTAKPPYFCIHEYKQELDFEGDPLGQILVAMLAAQHLNENKFPILGAYILGRNWFFIVLDKKEYAVSAAYDAASDDIFQIFAILKKSKDIIQTFISF